MSRIADVPYYAQRDDEVTAQLYNLWRRARNHPDCSDTMVLEKFPGLEMTLEDAAWVCVDKRQNDLPVIAWVEFDAKGRDALHMPVRCKLNYYHYAASRVRVYALSVMEQALVRCLSKEGGGSAD